MMDYLPFEISMENRYLSKISQELEIMNDNKGNNSPKIIKSNDGILEKKQRFNELLMFDSIPKDIFNFEGKQEMCSEPKTEWLRYSLVHTPMLMSYYLILAYYIIKEDLKINGHSPTEISICFKKGEVFENEIYITVSKKNINSSSILKFADIIDFLDLNIDHFILWADPETFSQKNKRKAISGTTRQNVLMRDNYTCQICGATVNDGAKLEIDHIKPVSKGGTNDENNLQVLCQQCNREKHNREDLLHDKKKLAELEGK